MKINHYSLLTNHTMKQVKKSIIFWLAFYNNFLLSHSARPGQHNFLTYQYLYGLLDSFASSSVRGAVISLNKKGLVEKFSRNRTSFFRLTALGQRIAEQYWPGLFLHHFGNSKKITAKRLQQEFYLAVYRSEGLSLAGERGRNNSSRQSARPYRSLLKKVLLHSGFRFLSRGVYVNFNPIKDKIESELLKFGLWDQVLLFKASGLVLPDHEHLVFQAWTGIDRQTEAEEFIIKTKQLLKRLQNDKRLSKQVKKCLSRRNRDWFLLVEHASKQPGACFSLNPALNSAFKLILRLNQAWQKLSLADTV